jgi:hypothetical protein
MRDELQFFCHLTGDRHAVQDGENSGYDDSVTRIAIYPNG